MQLSFVSLVLRAYANPDLVQMSQSQIPPATAVFAGPSSVPMLGLFTVFLVVFKSITRYSN